MVGVSRTILLLIILLVLLTNIPAYSETVSRVNYLLIYDPVENTGVLFINAAISLPNCEYVSIPVSIFNYEANITYLNYTVTGNLIVSGVDYDEVSGDIVLFACNSGEVQIAFTASNVFTETGIGAYAGSVNTYPLRELGATTSVEIILTGKYNVTITPIEVTHTVNIAENTTTIVISGHGYAYLALISIIEVTETPPPTPTPTPTLTPTPTPTPTPAPPTPYDITIIITIVGVIAGLILAVAVIAILTRRK